MFNCYDDLDYYAVCLDTKALPKEVQLQTFSVLGIVQTGFLKAVVQYHKYFSKCCSLPPACLAPASHPQQLHTLRSWSPSLCASVQPFQASPNWMRCQGHTPSAFQRGAAAGRVGRHKDTEVSTTVMQGRSPEDKIQDPLCSH